MSRRPILAGNWKMNLLQKDAASFCEGLRPNLEPEVDTILFPSFPLIHAVTRGLEGTAVGVGGQDGHVAASGAHTGDVSMAQLADAGCSWVLCGHSERRKDHGESDELVAEKARVADGVGLVPLLCIGETQEERAAGRTFEVLERQVRAVPLQELGRFELAYEPVWAIGTGETAGPDTAQEAHAFVRKLLLEIVGEERAEDTRILYGGSAKPENVESLFAGADVDGFLVGGASLDSQKFSAMIRSCARPAS